MSIDRERVLHTARLAEVAIADDELPVLVQQLSRIVDYVEQLAELSATCDASAHRAGPEQVTLREDVVRSTSLARPVSEMAPEFRDGFFLVPRRGTMADE